MKKICGFYTTDERFFESEPEAKEHQATLDAHETAKARRLRAIQILVTEKRKKSIFQSDLTLNDIEAIINQAPRYRQYVGHGRTIHYNHESQDQGLVFHAMDVVDDYIRTMLSVRKIQHLWPEVQEINQQAR